MFCNKISCNCTTPLKKFSKKKLPMHALFKSNTCLYLIIKHVRTTKNSNMIQTVYQTMPNHYMGVTILEHGRTCIPRMIRTASVFLSIAEVRMCGAITISPLPYIPLCLKKHSDKFMITHPTEQNMCPSVQPKCYFLIISNSSLDLL
jgi:hypothetical protein